MSVKGQYTPDKLVTGEQFYIGGATTVRGYPEMEFLGDYGYNATIEIRTPVFPFPSGLRVPKDEGLLKDKLQLVYFCDFGHAFLRDPLVGEKKRKSLLGAGAGFRLNLWRKFFISVDWAKPLAPNPSDDKKDKVHIWTHFDVF
jgi:hemolysin activation/secretion protein